MFDENQMVTFKWFGKDRTKKATDIPRGSAIPLKVICDHCGATIMRTWATQLKLMKYNHNVDTCSKCKGKIIGEKQRFTIDKVRDIFEQEGCKLLSTEYHSAKHDKLRYIATCGHECTITLDKFRARHGRICLECHNKQFAEERALTEDYIRKYFEDNDCHVLECNYKNNRSRISYIAQCGHKNTIIFGNFQQGFGRLCEWCGNSGENSRKWKGGITELSRYLRTILSNWTQQQLKQANYTCEITGSKGELNVHHMYSFCNIRDLTLEQLDLPIYQTIGEYTNEELGLLSKTFLQNNEILSHPIVMLKSVHEAFHSFCGGTSHDTTPEQLEKFIEEYSTKHCIVN
jgi:hypothetical protein